MRSIELQISGMTCDHCTATVHSVLRALPGVRVREVNHATNSARVDLDDSAPALAEIGEAIRRAGYSMTGFRSISSAPATS